MMRRIAWQFFKPLLFFCAGLMLIWLSLPMGPMLASLLTCLLIAALCVSWWRLGVMVQKIRNQAPPVPGEVVFVAGVAAARIIGATPAFREGASQRWVRLDTPQALLDYAALNPDSRPLGVILTCEPDVDNTIEHASAQLSNWRHAIESAQRLFKRPLNVSLLMLQDLQQTPGALLDYVPQWTPCRTVNEAQAQLQTVMQSLSRYSFHMPPASSRRWIKRLVDLQNSTDYLSHYVLPRLTPEKAHRRTPWLVGIDWLDSGYCRGDAAWRAPIRANSTLTLPTAQRPWPEHVPLPERLLARFPPIRSSPVWLAKMAWGVISAALFFTALAVSSMWNNLQQIKQSQAALQAYRLLTPDQEPMRGQAIQHIQALLTQQSEQVKEGVPLKLGMGLYQGQKIQQALNAALRTYHPPQPEREVIRLESTALFDSGKAILKPDAKLALQSVLVWIQSNSGKRVLIDGHTDNVGNAKSNLSLSLARAQAVREWFVNASSFPVTHFSVQGMGDTQPLADNTTETGRSKNRRVEMILIEPPQ